MPSVGRRVRCAPLGELLTFALSVVVLAAALGASAWIACQAADAHISPQEFPPEPPQCSSTEGDAPGAYRAPGDLLELRLRYQRTWKLYRRLAPVSATPVSARRLLRLALRYYWAYLRLSLRLGSTRAG